MRIRTAAYRFRTLSCARWTKPAGNTAESLKERHLPVGHAPKTVDPVEDPRDEQDTQPGGHRGPEGDRNVEQVTARPEQVRDPPDHVRGRDGPAEAEHQQDPPEGPGLVPRSRPWLSQPISPPRCGPGKRPPPRERRPRQGRPRAGDTGSPGR